MKRDIRSFKAEAAFRARVAELGGTVIEPEWLGVDAPHRVFCDAGHECAPWPSSVLKGRSLCRVCVGHDPASAEAEFRARVAELGGTVLESAWRGASQPHTILCAAGHQASPRPNDLKKGRGLCRACARQDPATAEAEFRATVARFGGTVIGAWKNSRTRVEIRCAAGHPCAPRPTNLADGRGLCGICALTRNGANCLYIVLNPAAQQAKYGVTNNPTKRLGQHRNYGYTEVVRLLEELPGDTAPLMEQHILSALRLAGKSPSHGREFFSAHDLATVLDIIDRYPIPAARPETTITKGSEL